MRRNVSIRVIEFVDNAAAPMTATTGVERRAGDAFTLRDVAFEANAAGGGRRPAHGPPAGCERDATPTTSLSSGTPREPRRSTRHDRSSGHQSRGRETRNNVAGESNNDKGGGLSLQRQRRSALGVTITGNRSTSDSSGSRGHSAPDHDSVIRTNTTGNGGAHGGGISFTARGAGLSLTELAIEGNKSNDGGGLWSDAGTLTAERVSISGNQVIPYPRTVRPSTTGRAAPGSRYPRPGARPS